MSKKTYIFGDDGFKSEMQPITFDGMRCVWKECSYAIVENKDEEGNARIVSCGLFDNCKLETRKVDSNLDVVFERCEKCFEFGDKLEREEWYFIQKNKGTYICC